MAGDKMASATEKKAKFISHKLKYLKDEGDLLIGAFGQYLSQIIAAGESWTEGGDNTVDYLEISHMIDSAFVFLGEKSEELAGRAIDVAAKQHSRPFPQQPDMTSQPQTATSSTSETHYKLSAASLPSTVTSYPVHPADETQLKSILARIAVIEEALCSFRNNAEKVVEHQSGVDQQLKEFSESDKKYNSMFRKMEEETMKIRDTQIESDEAHKTILQGLEKQLQKLSEADKRHKSKWDTFKEKSTETTTRQNAINNRNETRLQSLEKQLHKLSTAQDRMKEEIETQTELTEKQLHKLSTAQDRMKEEMESQSELTEKLVHVPDQLESVKEKLDVFDDRICRIMDDCSNKHQDIEHVTRDLTDKVIASIESLQVISGDQDQKTTLLRELETRMQTLEADSGRNVEDVQKQVEKGETNFQILCQMLNDRLTPLEQLRTCLNERASTRDENIKQLSQVIQEVAVISPRLQQLELKCSRPRCGFSALTWTNNVAEGETISPYKDLYSNVGGNFDAKSGIFTAPVDGLYVTAISLRLSENEELTVFVKHNKKGLDQSSATDVCRCSATVEDTHACDVSVLDMKAGDTLVLFLETDNTDYENCVSFSCFLLS